jgi:hypothetical protein
LLWNGTEVRTFGARQLSQKRKRIFMAGQGRQLPEICFQRLLARIWPKTAVSQGSQKGISIAGRGRQMAAICVQKAPGQDLAQNCRFPLIPEGDFNSRPRAAKWQKFQKAFGQDLAQNGCFPLIPEGEFNCQREASRVSQTRGPQKAFRSSQIAFRSFQKAPRRPRRLLDAPRKLPEGV